MLDARRLPAPEPPILTTAGLLALGDDPEVEGLPGPREDRLLLGSGFAEAQHAALRAAGCRIEARTQGEHVVAPVETAFSAAAVRAALRRGRSEGRDLRVRQGGRSGAEIRTWGPGRAWLGYVAPGGSHAVGERILAAAEVELEPDERELPGVQLPGGPLVVADVWILPVVHWAQLLWANLLGLGPFLWSALVGHGVGALGRLAWAATRAGSTRPEDVAACLTRGGARIHRNATVEGCVFGPGCSVGAGAVVRGCVVGAGVTVEELADVEGCVLGAGARVQRQAMARFSVLEAGACHGGVIQLGVLGRDAVVKRGATLMDLGLGGQGVSTFVRGRLEKAPHGMLGGCVGPGSTLGSGVRLAPGRVVPPGVSVLADPDQVLARLDLAAGERRAVVRRGRLEPI